MAEIERGSDDKIADAYAQYYTMPVPSAVTREKAEWVLASIESRRVLLVEIGPGQGELLLLLRQHRPDWIVAAVEPRPEFRAMLAQQGVQAEETLESLRLVAADRWQAYGVEEIVVILDNVFEHICGPVAALKQISNVCRLLACKARIYIEVPNEEGIDRRARIQDFIRGTPKPPTFAGHVNLFEEYSLRLAADSAGLRVDSLKRHPIRNVDQVRYTMRTRDLPALVHISVAVLNLLPVDRLLGWEYWLRAVLSADHSPSLKSSSESYHT